jgi:hypothetical protein
MTQLEMAWPGPQMYTGAYWSPKTKKAVLEDGLVAVGITLYGLRRPPPYPLYGRMTSMAPNKAMFHLEPYEAFRVQFMVLLESRLERIMFDLEEVRDHNPGKSVVLLCFEKLADEGGDVGEWCHRRLVAEFIEQKTGQEVPEL